MVNKNGGNRSGALCSYLDKERKEFDFTIEATYKLSPARNEVRDQAEKIMQAKTNSDESNREFRREESRTLGVLISVAEPNEAQPASEVIVP